MKLNKCENTSNNGGGNGGEGGRTGREQDGDATKVNTKKIHWKNQRNVVDAWLVRYPPLHNCLYSITRDEIPRQRARNVRTSINIRLVVPEL